MDNPIELSLVVCAYKMSRELPRTLFTLSKDYQRGIDDLEYEIVVVDHGSPEPVDEAAMRAISPNARVIRVSPAPVSPVVAINRAMKETSGQVVCLMIDGARMASPGLLRQAMAAYRTYPALVVGCLAFHLGPGDQIRTIQQGYSQRIEDLILELVPWRSDGYSLFEVAGLEGSSQAGWYGPLIESNAAFMPRTIWEKLGGLDERFQTKGGGLTNLDFWSRAVHLTGGEPVILLGEGTFHQVHGGAATNGTADDRALMFEEYERIYGQPYKPPEFKNRYFGSLDPALERRFSPAGVILSDVLTLSPDVIAERAARIMGVGGDAETAEKLARYATDTDPHSFNATRMLVQILVQRGAIADAAAAALRLTEFHPSNAEGWAVRGEICLRLGNKAQAIAHIAKAAELAPDDYRFQHKLGNAYLSMGDRRNAESALSTAIKLNPSFAESHFLLSLALNGLNQLPDAIAAARQYLSLRPADPRIRRHLGSLLVRQGHLIEAEVLLRCANMMGTITADSLTALSNVLEKTGRLGEALEISRQNAGNDPTVPRFRIHYGAMLLRGGRLAEAEEVLGGVVEQWPHAINALLPLGNLLRQKGELENALELAERVLSLQPDNARARAQAEGLRTQLRNLESEN